MARDPDQSDLDAWEDVLDAAAIGYAAGYAAALRDGVVAIVLETRAAMLLEAFALPISAARRIVECARHDVDAEYPGADDMQRRAIAAQRICEVIAAWVRRNNGAGA